MDHKDGICSRDKRCNKSLGNVTTPQHSAGMSFVACVNKKNNNTSFVSQQIQSDDDEDDIEALPSITQLNNTIDTSSHQEQDNSIRGFVIAMTFALFGLFLLISIPYICSIIDDSRDYKQQYIVNINVIPFVMKKHYS